MLFAVVLINLSKSLRNGLLLLAISDVLSSGRFAEQTMSVNRSLLTNLRQGRHVAELEAQLKKLATTFERMSLGSVGATVQDRVKLDA